MPFFVLCREIGRASVLFEQLFNRDFCSMIEQLREHIATEGGYRKGIELLKMLGHNPLDWHELAAFAQLQFAPASAEMRVMALLRGYLLQLESVAVAAAPVTIVQMQNTEGVRVIEPPVIVVLRKGEKQLRDERQLLHSMLDETTDGLLRADKVKRIREITEQIDRIWTDLEAFEKTGKPPILAGTLTDAQTVDALYKREKTLRPRISRLNTFLKTSIPLSKKTRYEAELSEKEAELKLILEKLKGHG